MTDSEREFEENKDRMYWTIAIIVVLSILAFIASLYEPLLRKACYLAYQQAIGNILQSK